MQEVKTLANWNRKWSCVLYCLFFSTGISFFAFGVDVNAKSSTGSSWNVYVVVFCLKRVYNSELNNEVKSLCYVSSIVCTFLDVCCSPLSRYRFYYWRHFFHHNYRCQNIYFSRCYSFLYIIFTLKLISSLV